MEDNRVNMVRLDERGIRKAEYSKIADFPTACIYYTKSTFCIGGRL